MPGWVLMTSPLAASAHTHHLYLTLQRPTTQREQTMLNYKCICQDWQMCLSKLDNVSVKLAANVHHLYLNIQQGERKIGKFLTYLSMLEKVFAQMANSTSETLQPPPTPQYWLCILHYWHMASLRGHVPLMFRCLDERFLKSFRKKFPQDSTEQYKWI